MRSRWVVEYSCRRRRRMKSARLARNSVWLSLRGVGQNVRPRDERSSSCFVRVTWDRFTTVEWSRGVICVVFDCGCCRDWKGCYCYY